MALLGGIIAIGYIGNIKFVISLYLIIFTSALWREGAYAGLFVALLFKSYVIAIM